MACSACCSTAQPGLRRGLAAAGPRSSVAPLALPSTNRRARARRTPLTVVAAAAGEEDAAPPRPLAPSPQQQADEARARAAAMAAAAEATFDEEEALPEGVDAATVRLLGAPVDAFVELRAQSTREDVKAAAVTAAVWGGLAAVGYAWLGGRAGLWAELHHLTGGGASASNQDLVVMLVLAYFASKGAIMVAATAARAHMHSHAPAPAQAKSDGAAWWAWREAGRRREGAVTLALAEFAAPLAALCLMVFAAGGAEAVQWRLEGVDEGPLCRLAAGVALFWEAYVAGLFGVAAAGRAKLAEDARARLAGKRARQEERRRLRIERLRQS